MNDELFRAVLIVGFVIQTVVALCYRIRSYTGERLDRRQEGFGILIGLRVIALVFFAGVVTYLVNPARMAWSSVPLADWLRWCGVVIGTGSIVLKTWAFHTLGKNLTDTVVTRISHSLVTSGPYRWVRHPFYTSFALDAVAISLVMANWFVVAIGAMAMLFIAARTTIEEQQLIERFAGDYRAYMDRTGRYLPQFRR